MSGTSLDAGLNRALLSLALDGNHHPDVVGERAVAQVAARRPSLQVEIHFFLELHKKREMEEFFKQNYKSFRYPFLLFCYFPISRLCLLAELGATFQNPTDTYTVGDLLD